jgi:SLT domain-containing protein
MGKRESANNPSAVNGWDSNARAGIPSKGWMQTIEPTFNAHWRPGTSRNIFDPVANAAAAIHYVMTRYGVSADGSNLMARVQQANPYAPPKGY